MPSFQEEKRFFLLKTILPGSSLRMGALRFRLGDDEPFLDNQEDMAAPPWTKLRDLEQL